MEPEIIVEEWACLATTMIGIPRRRPIPPMQTPKDGSAPSTAMITSLEASS